MKYDIERCIEHMLETNSIRRIYWHMDDRVKDLLYGIRQGDDAVVVGKLLVNMEGPYPMKIGRKTGLIHTCSDIVVMGGRPLFAMNSMQVDSIKEAEEVSEDVKKQSIGLNVPIVGGNTQMENDLIPCISFAVIGELIDKPIPDAGAKIGDKIIMLGEVVEGTTGERVYRAKTKFSTFMQILEAKITVNASKDCSRGGWFGNLAEILVKSRKGIEITSIPYPEVSRYMGTYLISVPKKEVQGVIEIAARNKCPAVEVGTVSKELEIRIGKDVVVDKAQMGKLIRNMPYKKPSEKKK